MKIWVGMHIAIYRSSRAGNCIAKAFSSRLGTCRQKTRAALEMEAEIFLEIRIDDDLFVHGLN
jgi:hypothetical protein